MKYVRTHLEQYICPELMKGFVCICWYFPRLIYKKRCFFYLLFLLSKENNQILFMEAIILHLAYKQDKHLLRLENERNVLVKKTMVKKSFKADIEV